MSPFRAALPRLAAALLASALACSVGGAPGPDGLGPQAAAAPESGTAPPHVPQARPVEPHQPDTVRASRLPEEARRTLAIIAGGGPFPYRQDGAEFRNRERHLPRRGPGYYREYTVPTPGSTDRGARRIVAGRDGDRWYTDDHYRRFRRIEDP